MKTQIKKLLSILILIAILCSIICVPTSARELRQEEFNIEPGNKTSADGNWTYIKPAEFNEGEIALVEYKGTDAEVIIPETVDGYTVVAVGDHYEDVYSSLSGVKLVSKLFADDLNVTKVTLPKTFKEFGTFVYDCHSLGDDQSEWFNSLSDSDSSFSKESITEYIIDKNNPYFSSEDGIIYNKDKTELVLYPTGKTDEVFTLPESVKSFGAYAFAYSKLKRVENFDNIKELSYCLFMNSNLEEFPKMENIQEIWSYAFANCNNLESVTIPLSVDEIYGHAFYSCKNLKEVDFGEITYLGGAAFAQCSSLKEAHLPKTCSIIGRYAFSNCKSLEIFTAPYLEQIGECAFYKCISLKEITLTKNLKKIGKEAFYSCDYLEAIYYIGTKADQQKIDIHNDNSKINSISWTYNPQKETTSSKNETTSSKNETTSSKKETTSQNNENTISQPETETESTVSTDNESTLSSENETENNDMKKPDAKPKNNTLTVLIITGSILLCIAGGLSAFFVYKKKKL